MKNDLISVEDELPPLYKSVMVLDAHTKELSVGQHMGHGEFWHPKYPVAGQCKITHWRYLTPLSDEEIIKREPLPPAVLASALQDTVHKEVGHSRPAKSVKVKKSS